MFNLVSNFEPGGDQPQAIEKLFSGIKEDLRQQVLLGVTGSGKTYTMAQIIQKTGLPTLVVSPNKTLAAQLYLEFKNFFPKNAVHYFVSYYDYYQPEAYLPATDVYIAKDARINRNIDKLRHAALQAILNRQDLIVVASVSCLYGVGDPEEYQRVSLELKKSQKLNATDLSRELSFLQYERKENAETAGQFQIKSNSILIHLVTGEKISLEIYRGKIEKILNLKTGKKVSPLRIFPAKFWITPRQKLKISIANIKRELNERVEELQVAGKFLEAERLEKRVYFDLERLKKDGYINGIENYSRHLSFRQPGQPPSTILDYFPKPFLLFIDESHIAVPQLGGMYSGDRQRKQTLVNYGFRLPSALDNRPLKFEEFKEKTGQMIYVSATPGDYELNLTKESGGQIIEQIIRPTGLLDPEFIIRPAQTQIKSLLSEIKKRISGGERVLALTLTKRQAEDLTEFLLAQGIKAQYIHSEVKTLHRPEILRQLRSGEVDVLVGINLLREGLDLPEVSLIAILNADREGFLRNHRSLIQMAGRASRSLNGQVILYADQITESIRKAVAETNRRRRRQMAFNRKFNIQPLAIQKPIGVSDLMEAAGLKPESLD